MKATIDAKTLSTALAITGNTRIGGGTLPVLSNVLIDATSKGAMRFTCTDLSVAVTVTANADVKKLGSICAPARLLEEFAGNLSGEVLLSVVKEKLVVEAGKFSARISTIPAEEFPLVTHHDAPVAVHLPAGEFMSLVDAVEFSASRDDSRPALSGVLFRMKPDGMTLASTDGFRLSSADYPCQTGITADKLDRIIPAVSCRLFAKIGKSATGGVSLRLPTDRNQATLDVQMDNGINRIEVTSMLLEAMFPDYKAIIPTSRKLEVTVDTAKLRQAVKSASLFIGKGLAVSLVFDGTQEHISVIGTSAETGDSVSVVDAAIEGEAILPMTLGLNPGYLDQVLARCGENVVITNAGTGSPVKLEPATPPVLASGGASARTYVIMPMSLNT